MIIPQENKNRYITGIYALNLPSPDGTPGDWHYSAIHWDRIKPATISESHFKTWGLYNYDVPHHGKIAVATHIRACLDLIEEGDFSSAGGMNDLFLGRRLSSLVFQKVWELKAKSNWNNIDAFMGNEYGCKWLDFKEAMKNGI